MGFKILTWNIAYGYGLGSEGNEGYQARPMNHFLESLNAMGLMIKKADPDVVLLQEVDFHSKRSHFLDQLGILSRNTGLLYRSECTSWNRFYVPYPGVLPFRHFGRMISGGGILSKTPIKKIQIDLLPKPRENGKIYNHFYLSRFLQIVETGGFKICNLHLEAFSRENRELHLLRLQERLFDYDLDLAGGDFNGQITLGEKAEQYYRAVPAPKPTFPSNEANQTLDGFILKQNRFKRIQPSVLDSGMFSDHLPVLLELD